MTRTVAVLAFVFLVGAAVALACVESVIAEAWAEARQAHAEASVAVELAGECVISVHDVAGHLRPEIRIAQGATSRR